MADIIDKIGNSVVQYGRNNQRIYLMKSSSEDLPGLLEKLDELAAQNNYSKIFAKVPESQKEPFLRNGYQTEASVPGLFNGLETGLFLGKYLIRERAKELHPDLVQDILAKAEAKQSLVSGLAVSEGVSRPLFAEDMQQAAAIYRQVFASYPFPIDDPDYLRSTMDHIAYYGVWYEGQMVALSSAEIDYENGSAEMTDFATLPAYEGKGFASLLLSRMEADLKDRQITSLYTIARAYSHGMNITFAKNGYLFSGTLTNNTQIFGGLESMNVWYKLQPVEQLLAL
jgi:putative beta-lysine N-acetyltransferase